MPDIDGWEVWERMQADAELRNTPIVIVSGELREDAPSARMGIRAFLQKPTPGLDVIDLIERRCGAALTKR